MQNTASQKVELLNDGARRLDSENSAQAEESGFSRRNALLGGLLASLFTTSRAAEITAPCECLTPPDCGTVCPNGGYPKGDGSQACYCDPLPKRNRALALTDGGDAVNATAWGGRTPRMNSNSTDNKIGVLNADGDAVDYVAKESLLYTHPTSGVSAGTYNVVTVDNRGHVTAGSNRTYVRKVNGMTPNSSGSVTLTASISACAAGTLGGIMPASGWTSVLSGSWQSDYSYTASENCFIVAWHSGGSNNQCVEAFIGGTQVYHHAKHHNDGHNSWPMFFLLKGQTIRYTSNGAYLNIKKLKLQ